MPGGRAARWGRWPADRSAALRASEGFRGGLGERERSHPPLARSARINTTIMPNYFLYHLDIRDSYDLRIVKIYINDYPRWPYW
ncbi:MAG: hypothetical protein [Geminiviridae sp.]|nr:MAG: hypothetical protein [Geminiviridae sp.]